MNGGIEELKEKLKKIVKSGPNAITDESILKLEESFSKILRESSLMSDHKKRDILVNTLRKVQEYKRNKNLKTLNLMYMSLNGLFDQL